MQTQMQLEMVVIDLFEQLKKDNVIYAEIRFCPLLHTNNGLHPDEVIEIVANTTAKCINQFNIEAGLILSTLRHYSESQSMNIIRLIEKYINTTPVAGFDIAADEAGFSIDAHKAAFEYAIMHDIPRTAHAGEAKGPESVWETLENFKPSRIGHGVRSIEDTELVRYLEQNQIHLEICPSCNIQTSIYESYYDHPVDLLFKRGIPVGINTDARTLVNITLSKEYQHLENHFGWGLSEFKSCNLSAIDFAFIDDTKKSTLKKRLEEGYGSS
jgi:adenosine deaminase